MQYSLKESLNKVCNCIETDHNNVSRLNNGYSCLFAIR